MNARTKLDRLLALTVAALFVLGFAVSTTSLAMPPVDEKLSYQMKLDLSAPVKGWISEKKKEGKTDSGSSTKRGTYSRNYRKVDDSTYLASVHIDTAGESSMQTERYQLTLKKEGKNWEVAEAEVVDTYTGLYRPSAGGCFPFKSFKFDREGMKLSAQNGSLCETYTHGDVTEFMVHGADMQYEYAPPDHAAELHLADNFHAIDAMVKEDHEKELMFPPAGFFFQCDPHSCEELIASTVEGVSRPSKEERPTSGFFGSLTGAQFAMPLVNKWQEQRNDSSFAHFTRLYDAENRYYAAYVAREIDPIGRFSQTLPGSGVVLRYNNWGGFEVEFSVVPKRLDMPDQVRGTLFGYYSEETVKNTDPYEIERRDDEQARWYQVHSLKGTVEAALEDPEILKGDLEFGITLKQDLQELPFYIASIPDRSASGADRPRTLFVNSIQSEGQELTWVKTGPIAGMVILPEKLPKGTKVNLRMNFATRAIYKENHAFSAMSRFGWMPFVRFGDFIDDFELTIKSPAQYEILGIGHKVEEKTEGNVLISHWRADSPVVFPTLIFGKYVSDDAGKYKATKLDGTVIPVEVHVDEVSMGQLAINVNSAETFESVQEFEQGSRGIRDKQLRPIATQAAVAINLFKEISGLDYPYGELNLVNDPAPALYGQAPSSLIYLGSLVFRGEGTMAGGGLFGGGQGSTRTAKFLKSVVAHEVGHQWWGSRVSNANGRNYWFVETLAEYFSAIYLEEAFGKQEYKEQVEEWRDNILNARLKSSVQNASTLWAGEDGRSYQAAVYSKGPYAFHMLRETFGDEKFFPFLKQFTLELAEKREIVTLDIQRAAEKALGGVDPEGNPYNVDLSWFFDQWIRGIGIPQYRFVYDTRQTEDGGWLIEGNIEQRVVVGSNRAHHVMKDKYYRGVVDITVDAKGGESYKRRLVVEGPNTPFKLKVPKKPLEVALNKNGEILAHDVLSNVSWD